MFEAISEMPKNAWKARVISSSTSRNGYAGRAGPGSIPTSDQMNRYPLSRKCAVISTWPVWVNIASANSRE